jgi:hypothetical protein
MDSSRSAIRLLTAEATIDSRSAAWAMLASSHTATKRRSDTKSACHILFFALFIFYVGTRCADPYGCCLNYMERPH